eukprot:1159508-Pelagomonas_calceolata.AAC.1
MLHRLDVYARKKHLIINTVKSEVVHFNSKGNNLPAFMIGNDMFAHNLKDSFKHLGMMFYRTLNMAQETLPTSIKEKETLLFQLQALRSEGAISMNDFSADLRYRLQGVRREAELVDPRGNSNKLAIYQAWFATPFACNAHQAYIPLP